MLKQATALNTRRYKIFIILIKERKKDCIRAGLPNLASGSDDIFMHPVTPVIAIFFFTGHCCTATDFLSQKLIEKKSATNKFPSIRSLFKKLTANVLGWFRGKPFRCLGSVPMKFKEIMVCKIKLLVLKKLRHESIFVARKISLTHG